MSCFTTISEDIELNYKERIFDRDNERKIKTKCALIATTETSAENCASNYSGSVGRWKVLRAFLTSGGNLLITEEHLSQWQGERTRYSAVILKNSAEMENYAKAHTTSLHKALLERVEDTGLSLPSIYELLP